MKIAVCFSGMIRTGLYAAPNILNFIGDVLPNCDFFLHTWDQQSNRPPIGRHTLDNTSIASVPLLDFCNLYNIKQHQIDNFITVGNRTLHPLWHSWTRSVNLAIQGPYDYIVKIRPDIIFDPHLKLSNILNTIQDNTFHTSHTWTFNEKNETTMEDVFFVSKSNVMNTAIGFTSTNIQSLDNHADFCKFLTSKDILVKGLDIMYFRGDYSILRPEYAHLDPITSYSQCERGDKSIFYPG